MALLTVCTVPGCPNLAPAGQRGRCDQHRVLAKGSQAWRRLSAQVIAEEHRICHWCSGPAVTADHLVPISLGGTDDRANLVAACRECNSSRGGSIGAPRNPYQRPGTLLTRNLRRL